MIEAAATYVREICFLKLKSQSDVTAIIRKVCDSVMLLLRMGVADMGSIQFWNWN